MQATPATLKSRAAAALMALAFVLGVMHLVWMFALTLAVAAEKMLPHGKWISRGLGGVMVLAAVLPA